MTHCHVSILARESRLSVCLQVVGDGTLRINFTKSENPFPSRDSNSRCCSGSLPSCSRASCQPHFEVCYKGGTSAGSCLQPKLTQTFTVPPLVSHTIIFNDNETIFNFTFQDSAPVVNTTFNTSVTHTVILFKFTGPTVHQNRCHRHYRKSHRHILTSIEVGLDETDRRLDWITQEPSHHPVARVAAVV